MKTTDPPKTQNLKGSTIHSALIIVLIFFHFDLSGCRVAGELIGSSFAYEKETSFQDASEWDRAKFKPGHSIRIRFHDQDGLIGKYPIHFIPNA